MFKVLKVSDDFIVLAKDDGRLKRVPREAADFSIALGDKVELYEDGDIVLLVPAQQETDILAMEDSASPQNTLLRGILDLFAETLATYSKDKAGLGRLFPQFLMTLFLAWALVGVLGEQVLILLLSLLVFIWRGLLRFGYWLTKRRRSHLAEWQEDMDDEEEEATNFSAVSADTILDESPSSTIEVIAMDRQTDSKTSGDALPQDK
ncbi:hypothetical protein [Streptococcus sp. DD12]|uniref:hypothetical protein n=1 Tax=Streptococcus sp. DD12 TaxID=1777880 RepID=UPI00079BA2F2|nr:hypothetical protein [Streptococcus sp. DD12]KXT75731.1 hypothetical protein STRDD12_00843 [Streptococcus sp. DD12]